MDVRRFFGELKRRHVFRIAAVYAVVAWIVMQIGEVAFPALGIPDWALSLVIVLAILLFPLALLLAWAFDLTPGGVVRTESRPAGQSGSDPSLAIAAGPETGLEIAPAAAEAPEAGDAERAARSIVVLPFRNMSPDADNAYFSDGISEDLITQLTKVGGLRVLSRSTAFRYRDVDRGAPAIGRELGVGYILEGSVRRSSERVRIVAQLIDARTDDHLWAETYDRVLEDLFQIQSDVANRIVRSLAGSLSENVVRSEGARPSARPTGDMAAYDLYLKGRFHWNRRTGADLDRSLAYLRQAADRDPEFAAARAGLADSYTTFGIYGLRAPREVMPLACEAADRALTLDPESAEALTARACVRAVYEWDWERAESEFRGAIALNPQYATAHQWFASHHLIPLRRFAEAREAFEAARRVDPMSPAVGTGLGVLCHYERDYDAAIERYEAVLAATPEFVLARFLMGLSLIGAGRPADAVEAMTIARERSGETAETMTGLGRARAAAGDERGAREILAELEDRSGTSYVSPARLAQLHVALGEPERALDRLADAVQVRAAELIWIDVWAAFDPLRDAERFQTLRAEVMG